MVYSPDLGRLLAAGSRYAGEHAEYVIEPHDAGTVIFPTGWVVGCVPLAGAYQAVPFTTGIVPGAYSLRAWVAVLVHEGAEWQRRVAALQLVIDDAPASRWEPALTAGQDVSVLGGGPVLRVSGGCRDRDAGR